MDIIEININCSSTLNHNIEELKVIGLYLLVYEGWKTII